MGAPVRSSRSPRRRPTARCESPQSEPPRSLHGITIAALGYGWLAPSEAAITIGCGLLGVLVFAFVSALRASRSDAIGIARTTDTGSSSSKSLVVDGHPMRVGYDARIVRELVRRTGAAELAVLHRPGVPKAGGTAIAYRPAAAD